MKNKTNNTLLKTHWVTLMVLLSCLLFSVNQVSAETIVTNTVNVTANGGESSASVKTVINGTVVEDWSATSTEPITYSHLHTSDTEEVNISSEETKRSQLLAMVTQLEALISFYVSLLNN